MLDEIESPNGTTLSHFKPADTVFCGDGLRDIFLYRDLGIGTATGGKVIAQLVIAHNAPETGAGGHRHEADFHIVIVLRGWAHFMHENQETRVSAGDCVHQRPGMRHDLFHYAPDMECLAIVGPADIGTVEVEPAGEVPASKGWCV